MKNSNAGFKGVHFEARFRPDKQNQATAAFRGYAHRRHLVSISVYSYGARHAFHVAAKAALTAHGMDTDEKNIDQRFNDWWQANQATIEEFFIPA